MMSSYEVTVTETWTHRVTVGDTSEDPAKAHAIDLVRNLGHLDPDATIVETGAEAAYTAHARKV